ncbi:fused isobutyryl-CoA mutase/GTPase IcmF [Brevibacillus porteri]|uniref:Fused isobutyryl-CoA mutase n=1 Tax=Brevibacillus porteri TaxID=2126350 RepID=A0ABX5FJD5_9BACL|nr:fused isobutyryl-CoA mutase/GTPase IcmF [Brevibacillus porteri]MED1798269.1 methylmalonyl-CoA mutase family protein [Brevibacillus porteri]MED2133950.1 methylmalonyl-CoA mutase family protein [Brevibacillus porteri]MED2743172.1 methylmalonyl-CoA mutase family protein [Brevibacillus porteri]MED2815494.1 methylmalonyl-CoA mutase family protein [Brevibacillus porteri]MED2892268.1 methylmalonyl-CoA mutase family protein [Brevibacillus porteri]
METEVYRPQNKVRFVTAASLYDGHDASINIMRRILQSSGVEVIHLGHNRSVDDIVTAAVQEDVQGIAISSYQGGHVEYFKYVIDLLRERGAEHIRVFGGGGGVIVPREIRELEEYGVCKIYSPDDGRRLGLQGMINDMIRRSDFPTVKQLEEEVAGLREQNHQAIARLISVAEYAVDQREWTEPLRESLVEADSAIPVLGITGTGGAGKSSLTDELVRRFIRTYPEKTVAILSVDPSKQKSGGALLGDRIRMNANSTPRVYMRSLATRKSGMELSAALKDAIQVTRSAHFDLIIVETSGIGQGDAQVTEVCDVSMYVMTSEFGAPSQLEKIDMLDFADVIAINKFERKGSEDALREVRKQYRRNHQLFELPDEKVPVYGTIASQFNDPGTNVLFAALMHRIVEKTSVDWSVENLDTTPVKIHKTSLIPTERINYLQDIANTVRQYRAYAEEQSLIARKLFQLQGAKETVLASGDSAAAELVAVLDKQIVLFEEKLHPECRRILENWPKLKEAYRKDQFVTKIRDKELVTKLFSESLSGTRISKVAVPDYEDWGEILKWSLKENVPGEFPYTAGVFPFKREGEDPKRQFAGEGTPERTNRRFHFLSQNDEAKRLSTAFDSVTLYGEDPDYRPDIYGKIGTSGVSICTLDDMKKLYAGFDLCAPSTSVSMTINGPAPMILAMFMNTAIEQQLNAFVQKEGRQPTEDEAKQIRAYTLSTVRGTVQADILKEDQGQNTCIFSTEFALRMMGDIQQYFIDQKVRNYYSVSISGYHIAEAGANPITQLAFTLSNGFTYVEYYLSRGMNIDDFAPNLSFFFSNGLDPEYTVIGRVARRIWATVMKNRYGANDRSQKLKYHIQTSGRSLHAQEMDFNDIRTTLQALIAIYDNCNSLHTNAYDEAITTPTENSVRRAMAIQMIINKEMGLAKNENPLQGAFIIDELTDLVEESVMQEFERISSRGGVLGAMETQYQRGKIQDESMYYEMKKHTGELPIIGVNTFINPNASEDDYEIELARATEEEKEQQIINLRAFQERHKDVSAAALRRLQEVAMAGENIFAELMETVKVASLGQISGALYEVGGQYRRNM